MADNNSLSLTKEIKTRECEPKDFGNDSQSLNEFKKINNSFYLNLCPDT